MPGTLFVKCSYYIIFNISKITTDNPNDIHFIFCKIYKKETVLRSYETGRECIYFSHIYVLMVADL